MSAGAAYLLSPPSYFLSAKSESTLLQITRGSSFKAIALYLEDAGVIRSALAFELLALIRGERSLLKSGEYVFTQGMPASDVLGDLVAGRVKSYQITFIEGWTLKRCLEALAASPGLIKTLSGIDDPGLIALNQQGISSAEGLFDANTFRYVRGDTDRDLLQRAQKQLTEKLAGYWNQRPQDLPLNSSYEALILASIVEKETGIAEERSRIAGVFYNRINSGMRLQSDPTTIYGLGDRYTGRLTREQLREETPYNTYRIDGLPPTPISLVSDSAIAAVLNPEIHGYFYFVSNSNGGHVFSRTLEEHNTAVAIYRAGLVDSAPQTDAVNGDNNER